MIRQENRWHIAWRAIVCRGILRANRHYCLNTAAISWSEPVPWLLYMLAFLLLFSMFSCAIMI